jgi:uncharacterized protein (TIGR03067 family)
MRSICYLSSIAAFVLLLGIPPVAANEARHQTEAAKTELDGTWDGEMSIGGGRTRTFAAGEMWIRFRGNMVSGKKFLGPDGEDAKFETDSKASPKHVDFSQTKGNTIRAIYEIQGDSLTIAISLGATYPSGFKESDQAFRVSILKLKRRK